MRNANKSPKIRNGEGSGKVILDPFPGPEHRQQLTSSCEW